MRQQRLPTVGDTVTIVAHIVAPPGAVIEARAPADSSIATLIAPPVLTREGDSVRIAYTVAVWNPGHSDLVFPGAVIVDLRGRVDTLADTHVPLDVASVLPARSPGSIAPHAARPWLVRTDVSWLPFAVLVPLALLLVAGLHWWWRRRGPAPAVSADAPVSPAPVDARIAAWLAAGESRLALEHLAAALQDGPGVAAWRDRVASERFAEGNDAVVDALVREGAQLAATRRDRADAPVASSGRHRSESRGDE